MTNKTPKQCRERYENYVNPKITNSEWTNDEEQMLIKKYVEMGPHWVKLSKFFKTRSVNNIRNKWLMLKRKNQINLDIFPKMELIDSNDESSVGSPDNIDNIEKSELSDELDKLEEDIEAKDKLKSIDIPNFAIEEIENDNEDIFSFVESKVKDYPIFDTPRSDFELTMESFYPFF
ncbi:Myb-like DNA-binding domain containing protein [Tritrichomonas foetus]|uniref:Myb-like DNA-binding domain containing protein n=1 Tax=Tritrichomonas foetus TaxID=1144522 RepID=A0A1J4KMX1_9EUKA|nr:Myb-like DNA-binding domain containing protein [Tritrichomonas foetus]|eukprot:OHT10733.1 Myb-like DNA-binding domain containing protein [Tritrichomonas foetus]